MVPLRQPWQREHPGERRRCNTRCLSVIFMFLRYPIMLCPNSVANTLRALNRRQYAPHDSKDLFQLVGLELVSFFEFSLRACHETCILHSDLARICKFLRTTDNLFQLGCVYYGRHHQPGRLRPRPGRAPIGTFECSDGTTSRRWRTTSTARSSSVLSSQETEENRQFYYSFHGRTNQENAISVPKLENFSHFSEDRRK